MQMQSKNEDAYFAASNSAKGFYSYYTECFDLSEIKHLYAIKGGPGTGKSRFMRDVAAYGKEEGFACEWIYCSSDPASLDGIILRRGDQSIALLDATAPHIWEPKTVGAREDIVNLGVFWDIGALERQAETIETLSRKKSEAYRRAYRYLGGVGELVENRDSLMLPFIRMDKLEAFAEKLTDGVGFGTGYRARPALMRSIGMQGEVGFDTYFAGADRIVLIEDYYGSAQYLMRALGNEAVKHRQSVRLSHDPICPDRLDAIMLTDRRITFAVCPSELCEYPHQAVRMRRFVKTAQMREVRGELGLIGRMNKAMLGGALGALAEVREAHFALEAIYSAAMNFEGKEAFTKIFCKELFDLQNR